MNITKYCSEGFSFANTAQFAHYRSRTLSMHMAMDQLYSGIREILDKIIESLGDRPLMEFDELVSKVVEPEKMVAAIKLFDEMTKEMRRSTTETHLQQLLDDMCELLYTTIYKVTYLK
jgi:hypothetical protein